MPKETFSSIIIVIVIVSFVALLVEGLIRGWFKKRRKSLPDNALRMNVRKKCKDCGRTVITDVFAVNPTCAKCQDRHGG